MDLDKTTPTKSSKITSYLNIILIALVILLVGYFVYKKGYLEKALSYLNSPSDELIEEVETTPELNSFESSGKIIVDIQGAIITPGVYELDSQSRVVDVVKAAGGFADFVDANYVSQNINQAQKVSDGMKIYIPIKGVEVLHEPIQSSGSESNPSETPSSGLISLNNASQKELESLPEIGEVTAQKIISNRPYANLDDVVKKGALKQSSFDKIKSQISI